MRFLSLAIVATLLPVSGAAQSQLPLEIGNIWEYQSMDADLGTLHMEVTGDTTLPNGQTYSVLAGSVFFSGFLRRDGPHVYAYDVVDTMEYQLFDFQASPGDTMAILPARSQYITLQSVDSSSQQPIWEFTLSMGFPGYSYDFMTWWITDGVGVYFMVAEPGIFWHLSGAAISGDTIGTLAAVEMLNTGHPKHPFLESVYPNPFNPATTIRFVMAKEGNAVVDIVNLLGQSVETLFSGRAPSGPTEVHWNGRGHSSGVYFVRFRSEGIMQTSKVALLR